MRLLLWTLFFALLLSTTQYAQQKTELKTKKDSLSYSIGVNIGQSFKMQSLDMNVDLVSAGMRDALSGKTKLTEEQVMGCLTTFQQEMTAKQQAEAKIAGAKNKEEGEKFLAENAKKEGVKVTGSGLQYMVIKQGDGKIPTAQDKVKTHYKGTLIGGKEFDSSYKRGEPAVFPVTGVIKGWTEALQLMPVGSKWMLFIPSNLAYGERGAGADIGPDATLIFEIELLGIE